MFILIGSHLSGKTFFIKNHIQKNNLSKLKIITEDIKPYIFRNSYIIDTPDINKYKDSNLLISKCIKIIGNISIQDLHIIYFVNKYEDINLAIKRWVQLRKIYSNIVLLDIFKVISIKNLNMEIIDSYNALIKFMKSKIDEKKQKNINTKKSIIMIGITNVGKTSILNDLMQEDIFRISDSRNTTSELTFSIYKHNHLDFKIYDTCGLENNTKSKILGISNLIKYVERAIIVMDNKTYTQKTYQYIFNFLNKNLVNTTFLINKSDLMLDDDKDKITNFLCNKYKISLSDIFFNRTIGNSNTKSNFNKIISISKQKINHHLLNKKIKKYFPNILYLNENSKENSIYNIDVYMKRKLDIRINLRSMMQRLRNLTYKFINNRNFAIKFNIIKSLDKNKNLKSEYKRANYRTSETSKHK